MNNQYVVATIKPWNHEAFENAKLSLPGTWHLITEKEALSLEWLEKINPRFIFFPHWSWIVPNSILSRWDCVCFHMADVPYGRGGSPLQNLISRKHQETKISALKMVDELDAGPVYLKRDLSLSGTAQDIFERVAPIAIDMAREIAEVEPLPVSQSGGIVHFKRRTPEMSQLPTTGELSDIYDHIRMLDADTYPRAYLTHGDFVLEFNTAIASKDGYIEAKVRIKKA